MLDLAWVSLAALVLVIVLSCTTSVNPGFLSLALAWVIGVYRGSALGTEIHSRPGACRLSHGSVSDPGGSDAALYPGPRQWHARPSRAEGVARLPGERRADSDRLLRPFPGHRLDRGRKHRGRRLDRAPGHGGCGAGEDLPVPDDTHGGARLCGRALSPIAPTGIIANGLMARMGMSGFEWQNYSVQPYSQHPRRRHGLSCVRWLADSGARSTTMRTGGSATALRATTTS